MGFLGYADKYINASSPNASEYNYQRTQVVFAATACSNKSNGTAGSATDDAYYNALLAGFPDPTNTNIESASNFMGNASASGFYAKFNQAGQAWIYTGANYTIRGLCAHASARTHAYTHAC